MKLQPARTVAPIGSSDGFSISVEKLNILRHAIGYDDEARRPERSSMNGTDMIIAMRVNKKKLVAVVLQRLVSCLRGLSLIIRVATTFSFLWLAAWDFLFHDWSNFAWHITIAIGVCPAWDKDS
jgi:hypothetical protein